MTKRVVRSQKSIMGVDFPINGEWDAGYLPTGASFRRVRVTVKRDVDFAFSVYAVGFKGSEKLASQFIATFPCETCAKALALCIVFGKDYAECENHGKEKFNEGDIYDGFAKALLAAMGISDSDWAKLDAGSRHRLMWVARLVFDNRAQFDKVINAWEFTEDRTLPPNLNTLIHYWFTLVTFSCSR